MVIQAIRLGKATGLDPTDIINDESIDQLMMIHVTRRVNFPSFQHSANALSKQPSAQTHIQTMNLIFVVDTLGYNLQGKAGVKLNFLLY